jgi:hypothetical protein
LISWNLSVKFCEGESAWSRLSLSTEKEEDEKEEEAAQQTRAVEGLG